MQVFFLHKISIIEHSSEVLNAWHSLKIQQSGKCDSIRSPHWKRWVPSCQWPTNFPLIFHVLWMHYWIYHFHSAEETFPFRATLIKVVHLRCTPDAGWMELTLPSVMGGGVGSAFSHPKPCVLLPDWNTVMMSRSANGAFVVENLPLLFWSLMHGSMSVLNKKKTKLLHIVENTLCIYKCTLCFHVGLHSKKIITNAIFKMLQYKV